MRGGHHVQTGAGPYCWTVTSTCGRPSPRRASRSCLSSSPSHPARRSPMRISRHPSSRFMRCPSMNGVFAHPSRRESRLDRGLDLQQPTGKNKNPFHTSASWQRLISVFVSVHARTSSEYTNERRQTALGGFA